MSATLGGILTAVVNLYLFTVLNPQEFALVEPPGILGGIFLALGLPALYASEHHWFGRLATVGFWVMAVGWIGATIGLPVATYGPGIAFLATLLGWLIAMLGALMFGVAILRTDAATVPRLGAWLYVAALPVGLPLAIGFTTYVMGQGADPWAGPLLFYGLAWIVFGRSLRRASEAKDATTEIANA
ncbi:hypothetical protein [Halegenticoccus soli]|uniref:hypothetical protein n=1 Tax=Halegenticoccus soli TaxID=1985678 RepID=UPI00117B28F1|nr:hypothetical protein [Halegenticoccus soli]